MNWNKVGIYVLLFLFTVFVTFLIFKAIDPSVKDNDTPVKVATFENPTYKVTNSRGVVYEFTEIIYDGDIITGTVGNKKMVFTPPYTVEYP